MAKDRKLKAALERHKGVDHKLEHQRKLQKQAEKRKRQRKGGDATATAGEQEDALAQEAEEDADEQLAADLAEAAEQANGETQGWETDESENGEDANVDYRLDAFDDESDSDSEKDGPILHETLLQREPVQSDDPADEEKEDVPLSEIESLASEDRGDVIPYQRLTINNTTALARSLKSFALPSNLPFSATQVVISANPVEIADVEDDLNRELAFYKQSLDAVKDARKQLKKEGVMISRPADYFAEMVKSEEQMGKVKQKMVDEAARKKASADARRQRDLKKFGKAVQVAKLQERDRAKRDTLDKINVLKRKRQGADLTANEDSMFDVALEDAGDTARKDKADRRAQGAAAGARGKRQKKDEKFGYGGKKRFAKSNDARSSGDMGGFSTKKMKGSFGKGGKGQRPGKSRRAAKMS